MGKKLTEQEVEDRTLNKVMGRLKSLEKKYPKYLVEKACAKYKAISLDRRRAEQTIADAEKTLADAKKRMKQ